jgi:hypothetical protein
LESTLLPNVLQKSTKMAMMDPTKLEPLLQGPMEATGLYVEFFGATLRHGTYLKLKTDRISNDLDDFVEGDIVVGRIISLQVSVEETKGTLGTLM